MATFRGRSFHTLDSKGRVSIPVEFRAQLEGENREPPILTNGKDCLELYPYEAWLEREEIFAQLPAADADMQRYVRFKMAGATSCPIDKQGRILIPAHLRDWAELEREVVLSSANRWLELWDKARYAADMDFIKSNHDDFASRVADLERTMFGGARRGGA